MANKIRKNRTNYCFIEMHNSASIFLDPVQESEVVAMINSFKEYSSPGFDGITSTILKNISANISKPMSFIINLIFLQRRMSQLFQGCCHQTELQKGQ